jgi:arylformamidase
MTDVFLGYDQRGLDEAYDQKAWASNMEEILSSYSAASVRTRDKFGEPLRFAYGPTEAEKLDVFRTTAHAAPIQILVHGGAWRRGAAADYAFPAEMFVAAGIHYVALDFSSVIDVGGDLRILVSQIRRPSCGYTPMRCISAAIQIDSTSPVIRQGHILQPLH